MKAFQYIVCLFSELPGTHTHVSNPLKKSTINFFWTTAQ